MIGLDTNVLLRWIVNDPSAPEQSRRVAAALEAPGTLYVNLVVLAETAWVLTHRAKFDRDLLADAVSGLLAAPGVKVEAPAAVDDALAGFRAGGGGFVDHLIGALNRRAGCTTTLTFDRAARRSPDFSAVP